MILSHEHRFVFIKNQKVAGTSIELFLAQHCGPDDVITTRGGPFQNAQRTEVHAPAHLIRKQVGGRIWADYFTFCFDRDPVSKTISAYHYKMASLPNCPDQKRVFLDQFAPFYFSDAVRYFDPSGVMVDFVGSYARLSDDLGEACKQIPLPFDGTLTAAAKSSFKSITKQPFDVDNALKQALADAHALEASVYPWMAVPGFEPSGPAVLDWCWARVCFETGDLDGARDRLAAGLKKDPKHASSWLLLAQINRRQDRLTEAVDAIGQAVAFAPESVKSASYETLILMDAGDRDGAVAALNRAAELSPDNPHLASQRAGLLRKLGQKTAAGEALELAASAYDPTTFKWLEKMVKAACLKGNPDDGLRLVKEHMAGSRSDPNLDLANRPLNRPPDALDKLSAPIANEYSKLDRTADAWPLLRDPVVLDYDGGRSLAVLIRSHMRARRTKPAHEAIQWGLKHDPWHDAFYKSAQDCLNKAPDSGLQKQLDERLAEFGQSGADDQIR